MAAVDVTDEMRRAVYDADCDRRGHVPDISQLISNDPTVFPDENTIRIRAEDPDTVPHLFCKRCGKVWLVVDPAVDYDAAEVALNDKLQPKYHRQLRKQRRKDAAAAAQAAADQAAAAQAPVTS